MISKKVPMKSAFKSSFKRLVQYITDAQSKEQRIEGYTISNCENPDSLAWATREIESTQAQNKRAKSDKTYHFLISFAPGEQVSHETMIAIEDRMCRALGFGEHQRISAIHADTDNLHIHVAVNKIHPKTLNLHEPYQDFKIRSALCKQLEEEYGLVRTNHAATRVLGENNARDMERFSGIESLIGWVQRECLPKLLDATSWEQLGKVLADNGLTLRERGAGFVIQAEDGTAVKASSLDRKLSRPQLEKRLGAYPNKDGGAVKDKKDRQEKVYQAKPLKTRIDTTLLYARYKNEMAGMVAGRKNAFAAIKSERAVLTAEARKLAALQRSAAKLAAKGIARKAAYMLISKRLQDKLANINNKAKADRLIAYERGHRMAWNDWLREQAAKGNNEAAQVLRERKPTLQPNKMPGLRGGAGQASQADFAPGSRIDSITRQGTIIYKGPAAIRDTGQQIQIVKRTHEQDLRQALTMAVQRFGKSIHVDGDLLFKQQVVVVAARSRLDITFDDAAMERHRKILISNLQKKELHHATRSGTERIDGLGRTGQRTAAARPAGDGLDEQRARNRFVVLDKPHLGRVGTEPPPSRRNSLYDLSTLGMVHVEKRNEVLLPGHVPGVLDEYGTKRDSTVRRESDSALIVPAPKEAAAVAAYVQEREQKRGVIFDISKHLPYNGQIHGSVQFVGIRRKGDVYLALLGKDDSIYVKAIDKEEVGRLRSVAANSMIQIDKKGSITVKGRPGNEQKHTKQRSRR